MKKASVSLYELYWPFVAGPAERKAVVGKEEEWSSSFILLLLLISIVSYPFFVPFLLTFVQGILK
jgi:hypothetical protein